MNAGDAQSSRARTLDQAKGSRNWCNLLFAKEFVYAGNAEKRVSRQHGFIQGGAYGCSYASDSEGRTPASSARKRRR